MSININTQVSEGIRISDRVQKLRNEVKDISPTVDTERLKFMLEVYREMEGEPTIMKRSRLFEKHLTEKSIYIIKYLEGTYFVSRIQHAINSGQTAHVFTIGGLTEEGEDATNELDFLLLETQIQLRCIQPSFQLFL